MYRVFKLPKGLPIVEAGITIPKLYALENKINNVGVRIQTFGWRLILTTW